MTTTDRLTGHVAEMVEMTVLTMTSLLTSSHQKTKEEMVQMKLTKVQ